MRIFFFFNCFFLLRFRRCETNASAGDAQGGPVERVRPSPGRHGAGVPRAAVRPARRGDQLDRGDGRDHGLLRPRRREHL